MELLLLILIGFYYFNLKSNLNFKHIFSLFIYHQQLFIDNLSKSASNYFRLTVILAMSFFIFHTFFKNLSANNIRTSTIIVDTKNLILSKTDLLNSYRNACWMHGEIDSELFKDSPPKSFLQLVWTKKNSAIPCFVKKTSPGIYLDLFKTYFVMAKKTAVYMLMQFFYKFIPYKMWISSEIFHRFSTFYYFSKLTQSSIKNEINKLYALLVLN